MGPGTDQATGRAVTFEGLEFAFDKSRPLGSRIFDIMIDGKPLAAFENTSTVHEQAAAFGQACPAPGQGNKCLNCRACWNKEIKNLAYAVDDSTRGIAVNMHPDEFLKLAADSSGDAEKRAAEYGAFDVDKFNKEYLPSLDIDRKSVV